ncbi:zinc finger BED domain-containing protein DAYSLEEPER-like [Salmo salar]|uniref:Zinc finger BED domain-containing protein DAYSLEEPER-like n=1 Tax=Salmo salar TaxID=8030 RepID=A0A1S3Q193_SALSA|nr:zinc finger BED domain-containing protein DAYSLEEPER-like [Salmo salar]|eukprot:XP_014033707.1 PREDICTED: zinc finger BED domain-containing protein DAYSLEEPER-like [Salmo salar]
MILPLKTRILQSMAQSEEDSTITRDVKAAIREDLNPRYPLIYRTTFIDLLHWIQGSSPCLFKSLSHLDPALHRRTYSELTTEIVATEEGQATEPTGPDSEASPPQNNLAVKELFGETFMSKETGKTFANTIKEEVASYKAATSIPVDGDPLAWWKSNECKYPHIAMMARCHMAMPGTSVPSERVFSIVTAKRSTLSPDYVDILIFLKNNLKL